ncbi:MAG: response regulator [Myxococcales bacterium]|nr:response regulator [Myxococcales bacterium]
MPTILAVEDDPDLRSLLTIVLEQEGYVVTTATNGREALSRVEEQMPDLILLDLRMPVMSGVEFVAQYQARYGSGPRAPFIVMTAGEHASRRCQQLGGRGFLPKPFSADELVEVVRRYAPRSRPAASG